MIPFLPVIFIMLTAFSLTFWIHEKAYYPQSEEDEDTKRETPMRGITRRILEEVAQGDNFYPYFENQYKLMFADFDSFTNRDVLTIILLLLATLLVPLVFLNLLIALISEAF